MSVDTKIANRLFELIDLGRLVKTGVHEDR